MPTSVYQCSPVSSSALYLVSTSVFLCLPVSTNVYQCLVSCQYKVSSSDWCLLVSTNHLSLFWSKMRVLVGENELDCVEEIRFPRSVSPDNHIMPGIERFNYGLLSVGFKPLKIFFIVKLL